MNLLEIFIREGERECSVTVIFSDNTKIKNASKSKTHISCMMRWKQKSI